MSEQTPSEARPTTVTDRLVIALDPSPGVREIAARRVVEFAAELGDVDLVEGVALAAEHPADGVGTTELAARSGASPRQIRWWTEAGWLVPNTREHTGHGFPLTYPGQTVLKARVMASLVRLFTMGPPTASAVADEIINTGRAQAGGFTLTKIGPAS